MNDTHKRHIKKLKPVTVYVGNLVYSKTEAQIKRMFSKYGKVKFVRLVQDRKTKKNKGIAFVQMTNPVAADESIKFLDGKVVDGRKLKVSVAQERDEFKSPVARVSRAIKSEVSEEKTTKTKPKRRESGLNKLFDYLAQNK